MQKGRDIDALGRIEGQHQLSPKTGQHQYPIIKTIVLCENLDYNDCNVLVNFSVGLF